MRCRYLRALVVSLVLFAGCGQQQKTPPLFRLLTPDQTGVRFANTITTTDSENVQTDVYVYNGAGVAIGDLDNDGLPDIFFSGNMVSSRLYLNKGNMRFDDVTQAAGVGTNRWATGATMVDINNDGYLDIYVSVSGPEWSNGADRGNLLFINNGNHTFTEAAARYGIADTGFTTHAVFLDYNGDGCLDLFLLNNSPKDFSRAEATLHPAGLRSTSSSGYNQLYRNNCDGTFTNVSEQAGILRQVGYGLGVAVADFNGDGRPDIYVSNDVAPNDVLYINNGDGTFTDKAARWLKHTSLAGMGVDVADFDNDGYKDILITNGYPKAVNDLDYQTAVFRARRAGDDRRALRLLKELPGYGFSNYLFRNKGDLTFTDMTQQWGMDRKGFSYGAAYADLNNDGKLDLVINHIDAPASIYENVQPDDDVHHYLQIRLDGEPPNRRGIGAKLILTAGGQKQYLYHSPYRGYMSTMDDREHFGLGRAKRVDSLEVIWPDGRRQVLMGLDADRMVTVRQSDGMRGASRIPHPASRVFQPVDPRRVLKYKHQTRTGIH